MAKTLRGSRRDPIFVYRFSTWRPHRFPAEIKRRSAPRGSSAPAIS